MEIAELILKFIDSLIYPIIIVFLVIFFRKELSGILRGDFKAKYKDLELTIERNRKTLENARETQKIAISRINETIQEVEPIGKGENAVQNIKILLNAMNESLNYWESEVMKVLRKQKGRYPEETLVDYYFQVESDPWKRSHEEKNLREAINTLLEKSFVMRDNGYLVLHELLLNKTG